MSGIIPFFNVTPQVCVADLMRQSCQLNDVELAKRSTIASIRVIISCLSILGSVSIIVSVLWRRILKSPKIHPIFVLSVADTLLGISWLMGGIFWYSNARGSWCYVPSLFTVILQCVSVNLTVIYALVAYFTIKERDLTNVLPNMGSTYRTCGPCKVAIGYIVAWSLPIFLVFFSFGIMGGKYGIVKNADLCSCWCLPYFGNVLPLAHQADWDTAVYVFHIRKLVIGYGVVLATTYMVVFILLIVVYSKILILIRRVRRRHERVQASPYMYGAVGTLLMQGHSQAKKRVIYFISVFIITGISNLLLACMFIIYESVMVEKGVTVVKYNYPPKHPPDSLGDGFIFFIYIVQSLTTPLLGFLNALVYGWTRQEFVRVGKHGNNHSSNNSSHREQRRRSFNNTSTMNSSHEEEEDTDELGQ